VDVIDPPATPLVAAARRLLHDSDPVVTGHAERSYRFAALLAELDGVALDHEVLYIGTVLHDVGLAPSCDGPDRFEVRGANAARELLLAEGAPALLADAVWDVIALHASTPLARHKSPVTRYANRGIAIDIRGPGETALPDDAVRRILDEFPRAGFAHAFGAVLIDEVRRHPDTVRWCWMESIAVEHVDGHRPASFLDGLEAGADFC
jgi:hypothetical protein